MKRNLFPAIAVAAAIILDACSVVEQFPESPASPQSRNINVKFTTMDVETKTAFGEFNETAQTYPTFWTASDVKVAMSLNFAEPVEAAVNKDEEVSRKASFSANFEDTGSPYRFYAFSPLSAVETISKSRNSWAVSIPSVQTPSADGLSCDEDAMLLYAKSEDLTLLPAEPISIKFCHVTTYCRLALKNLAAAFEANGVSDATVKSVSLTYSVPVAGDWYVNAEDGSLEEKDASYTITLKPSISDLSEPTDLWFALAPCTLDGATLNVSVNTNKGCLSREVTFGARTYVAGAVNKVSMDMAKGSVFTPYGVESQETYFQLVKDINDVKQGDEVIFVDYGFAPSYAMTSTSSKGNGFASVAKDAENGFSFDEESGHINLAEGSDVMVLTISAKNANYETLTFKSGQKYLNTATSGQTPYLTLSSSGKAFTLYSFDEGEYALYYSSSSAICSIYGDDDYFKIYSNTENSVYTVALFKKVTDTVISGFDPEDDPILENEEYGAYLATGDNTVHTPHVTQISREFTGGTQTFAILFPGDNTVLEFNGIPSAVSAGDSFTLNLRKIARRKKTVIGNFEVTVIKEEGARVWLSDQNGNGFIVKR